MSQATTLQPIAPTWKLAAEFFVRGTPAPGGSKTFMPFRRGGVPIIKNNRVMGAYVDDGKGNVEWRKRVAHAAKVAYRSELLSGALRISFAFEFERPKSHFGSGRNAAVLKADAPRRHTQKPDLSKLIRSTEDALTGIVWVDDSQAFEHGPMSKQWSDQDGATIRIEVEVEAQAALFGEAAK